MRYFRLCGFLVVVACVLSSRQARAGQADGDGIFSALRKEMDRNIKGLRLKGAPAPYFFAIQYTRMMAVSHTAALGQPVSRRKTRWAAVSGLVRVGNYDKDDTNFYGFSPSMGSTAGPLEGDGLALRRAAHTIWDSAYKIAVERYAKKEAYLASHPKAKRCNDWSRVQVRPWQTRPAGTFVTSPLLEKGILAASGEFRRHAHVLGASVTWSQMEGERFLLTSEGLRVHDRAGGAKVAISLYGQATDGQYMTLGWSKTLPFSELKPARLGLVARAKAMAEKLRRLLEAPTFDETFSGPILLEGAAAATLWTAFIGKGLRADMPPVAWASGRMVFEGMKGRRVLPESVTIVDDPTATRFRGTRLFGHYVTDDEGVAGQKVVLVERGKLKGFLASRRPSVETKGSNGHGRDLSGWSLSPRPNGSNVFVKVRRPLSSKSLKRKYLSLLRREGLDHGYIIRSFGNTGLSRAGFGSYGTSPSIGVPPPVEIYRVDTKGREHLVRKVRIQAVQISDFASIPAVGGPERLVNVYVWTGRGVSLVYRDFIFPKMNLTRPATSEQRLPSLPSPLSRLLTPRK